MSVEAVTGNHALAAQTASLLNLASTIGKPEQLLDTLLSQ